MAINVVQASYISDADSGNYGSNITAGNSVFVVVVSYTTVNTPISTSAVTVAGQSLTKLMELNSPYTTQNQYFSIWGASNSPGGSSTVSATVNNGTSNPATGLALYEVSGLGNWTTVDQSASNSASTGTAASSGSTGTTTNATEFVLGAVVTANGLSAGPTGLTTYQGIGGYTYGEAGYSISSTTGTFSISGTESSSGTWCAGVVTIAPYTAPATVSSVKPANPGSTWKRHFRGTHQVPTYHVGISANVTGLVANATVAANYGSLYKALQLPSQKTQPGLTWKRRFQPESLHVTPRPSVPTPTPFIDTIGNLSVAGATATITVPILSPAYVGNTLIGVAKGSSSYIVSSVTDSQGNNWTVDVQGTGAGGPTDAVIRSIITKPLSTTDTVTITLSNSAGTNIAAIINQYQGIWATKDIGYSTASSTSVTTTTITSPNPTQYANELIISSVATGGASGQSLGFTVSSAQVAMTLRAQVPASPGLDNLAIADGLAVGNITPAVKWTWPTSETVSAVLASYTQTVLANIARPANPGRVWRRRYNQPEHLAPFWNAGPVNNNITVNGLVSNVNVVANFGSIKIAPSGSASTVTVAGQIGHTTDTLTGIVAQVNAAASFGNVIEQIPLPAKPVAPGRTWSRLFRKHQVLPYRSAANVNVYGLVSTVNVVANFGTVKAFVSESVSQVNVTASFGSVSEQIPLPATPIRPGRTWSKRFRKHQVLPYKSAANANVYGLTATVSVAANFGSITNKLTGNIAQVNIQSYLGTTNSALALPANQIRPGRTWLRQYRKHQVQPLNSAPNKSVTGLISTVNVSSAYGTSTVVPIGLGFKSQPGRTWKRRFSHRQIPPYYSKTVDNVTGLTATVNAQANFGSLSTPISLPAQPINPGMVWKRKYRRHSTPWYKSAANVNVAGLASSVTVAANFGTVKEFVTESTSAVTVQATFGSINRSVAQPALPVNPGKVWKRRFRRHQALPFRSAPNIVVAGLVSQVSVTANVGSEKIASVSFIAPVNPGRTWRRRYRRHTAPFIQSVFNLSIPGITARVTASSHSDAPDILVNIITASVWISAYPGSFKYYVPVLKWRTKIVKPSRGRVYNNSRYY
jgi:hypothetical protein